MGRDRDQSLELFHRNLIQSFLLAIINERHEADAAVKTVLLDLQPSISRLLGIIILSSKKEGGQIRRGHAG
jgi:hypothetical protein